jgi:cytochrome d ubiquinol oxidase subunit I
MAMGEAIMRAIPNGAPLALFGIPDDDEERLKYALEIPKLSSLILKHDPNAPLAGLKTIPRGERPPAEIIFWSFRIMVGLGFLMLGSASGAFSLAGGRASTIGAAPPLRAPDGPRRASSAVLAGWVTTEVGRQPYVIYNLMRTAEARAPDRRAGRARLRSSSSSSSTSSSSAQARYIFYA